MKLTPHAIFQRIIQAKATEAPELEAADKAEYNKLLDKVFQSSYFQNLDYYNHDAHYTELCKRDRERNKMIEIKGLVSLPNIDSINRALHAASLDFAKARKDSSESPQAQESMQAAKSFLMDFSLLLTHLLRKVLLPVVDDFIKASRKSTNMGDSKIICLNTDGQAAIGLIFKCLAVQVLDNKGSRLLRVPTRELSQLNLFLPATTSDGFTRPNVLSFNFNETGTCETIDLESIHQSLIQTTSKVQHACGRDTSKLGDLTWGIDSNSSQERINTHEQLEGATLYLSSDDKDREGAVVYQAGFNEFRNLMSEPLNPALSG